ncbi:MAG: T9SS C-terminal target domain-containing protein [Dysgonomonas sp.]
MTRCRNIFITLLFAGVTLTANAEKLEYPTDIAISDSETSDKTMTLEVEINQIGEKIKLENVPTSGYLEVYSILGVKIKSFNLKNYIITKSCSIELGKGLYILKAGKVAKKIIVK